MNLGEGTRRLALLLGAVGAFLGGVVSYAQLQSLMRQRADHRQFEQLASSDVVQKERKEFLYISSGLVGQPPFPSEVNKAGIGTINWSTLTGRIESIEMQGGQTLYPTPAPSAWAYLLTAILPLLGFFVPWGAVRAIGWVAAGFVTGPR